MDPLTFHIDALTEGRPEVFRFLLTEECAKLGIEFVCAPEFGFISDSYPNDHPNAPFKSLASLVMLERIQGLLELDFESADQLMTALYGEGDLSFVETERQFSMRMAWVIIETSQIKKVVLHRAASFEEYQKMSDIKWNPINPKVRMYQAPPSS